MDNGLPIVFTSNGLTEFKDLNENDNIIVGGFGCTLIHSNYFDIPIEICAFQITDENYISGEDFGWFIQLYKRNITVKPYLKNLITHNYITSSCELKPYTKEEIKSVSQMLLSYFKNINL